jgi:hypothetical protein
MRDGQDVPSGPRDLRTRGWILGNGLGGSASGSAAGLPSSRTHALLIAAEPHGRLTTLLLGTEERVLSLEGQWDLGPATLEDFRLDPWPVWRHRCGGLVLERSVLMIPGHNAVSIAWRPIEGPPARLTVTPLLAARDPWALQHSTPDMRGAAHGVPGRVRVETLPGRSAVTMWHNAAFMPARVWRTGLARALDAPGATEDAFVPGYLEGGIGPAQPVHLVAASEDDLFRALAREDRLGTPPPRTLAGCVEVLESAECERRSAALAAARRGADFTARQAAAAHGGPGYDLARRSEPLVDADDPWVGPLALSLLGGLARRGHRLTLLASLPRAAERGSDTLRALAALIALRAFDPAREVLRGFAEYLNEGFAPGSFDPLDGTPRYGDPAPALWLVHAAELYVRRSEDVAFLRDPLYPALESVMQFYRAGTRHGVRVEADGLLACGEGEAAVRRADLNALWSHALIAMAQLARLAGRRENGAFYLAWAREHQRRFAEAFWDDQAGCLFEALGARGPERGISPGQTLAASLTPPLLPPERLARLVATLERELFTPWGLRDAPGVEIVRPEWLGPFYTAWLRARGRAPEAQARLAGWLAPLQAALIAGGGHLPERFDLAAREDRAEPPRPAGDPASVLVAAETLRAWVEDLDMARERERVAAE